MSNESLLERVRTAIDEVFGSYISSDPARRLEIIEKATFLAKDDPGEWAPDADVVIHCESGIPNGSWSPEEFEKWFDVSRMLQTHFCEHVNAAVIGVYRN